MAHSLVPTPITSPSPISASTQWKKIAFPIPATDDKPKNCCQVLSKDGSQFHQRRSLIYTLVGAGFGSLLTTENANAAAKRPPPPPPKEKKDPSVTGLRAKVLANIKRKEALKEEVAKLRERGKQIQ